MKKVLISFMLFWIVMFVHGANTTNTDPSKACFYAAFNSLKDMLEGKDSLKYEKAVFLTENAYYDNRYKYDDFKQVLDFQTSLIQRISESARQEHQDKYSGMKRYEKEMFLLNTDNWAIFKYITDTTFFNSNGKTFFRMPFTYSSQDPYGTSDWRNTQVIHLLSDSNQQGNCYPLAVLFKMFSNRLRSDARLTVTPNHIYIQNRNAKGDFSNVELATKSFPGDGSIQTLTYTTDQSIVNGMAQRMLTEKECVVLNLIYLAKGFEHRFNDNTGDFLINCANLALKYDSLSLNALLLKAEVTENRLFEAMKQSNIKSVNQARVNGKTNGLLINYEMQLSNLYKCGYREIPKGIEQEILASIQKRDEAHILVDNTPNPFYEIGAIQRYATLSLGLFDEMHEQVDTIQYYRASMNTRTKRIIKFNVNASKSNYSVDPVVFAMSVDPLTNKYPELTPYQFASNTSIQAIDLEGLELYYTADGKLIGKYGDNTEIRIVHKDYVEAAKNIVANQNAIGSNVLNNKLYNSGSHGVFETKDAAAMDWAKNNNPTSISKNQELASNLYLIEIDGKTYVTYTEINNEGGTDASSPSSVPPGMEKVGGIHSHGAFDPDYMNEEYSPTDKQTAKSSCVDEFLATPAGTLKKYNYNTGEKSTVSNGIPTDPKSEGAPGNQGRKNKIPPEKAGPIIVDDK